MFLIQIQFESVIFPFICSFDIESINRGRGWLCNVSHAVSAWGLEREGVCICWKMWPHTDWNVCPALPSASSPKCKSVQARLKAHRWKRKWGGRWTLGARRRWQGLSWKLECSRAPELHLGWISGGFEGIPNPRPISRRAPHKVSSLFNSRGICLPSNPLVPRNRNRMVLW